MTEPLFGVQPSAGATFSADGRYRYALERRWDVGPTLLFIMLNPSTAGATDDDPTIRRCVGFAKRWGYAKLLVGNLYALRATDPVELLKADDPIGPENDAALERLAGEVTRRAIVAWGTNCAIDPERVRRVYEILRAANLQIDCLRRTANGSPGHPLYVRRDADPTPWHVAP